MRRKKDYDEETMIVLSALSDSRDQGMTAYRVSRITGLVLSSCYSALNRLHRSGVIIKEMREGHAFYKTRKYIRDPNIRQNIENLVFKLIDMTTSEGISCNPAAIKCGMEKYDERSVKCATCIRRRTAESVITLIAYITYKVISEMQFSNMPGDFIPLDAN